MSLPPISARVSIAVGVVVAVVAATTAVLVLPNYWHRQELRAERDVALAFAQAWQQGKLDSQPYAGATGSQVAARTQTITAGLTPARVDRPSAVTVTTMTETARSRAATAKLAVTWTLLGGTPWRYTTTIDLRKVSGLWHVVWTPAVVHPGLVAGQVLEVTRRQPPRAPIIGAGGKVLVTDRPVVEVGLVPGRIVNYATTVRDVSETVGVEDTEGLARRLAAAGPDTFVDVITLRMDAYRAVSAKLRSIPGTAFRNATLPLSPATGFARALIGSVGPATADVVTASKGRVLTGDVVGLSGLQAAYDAQLAGTPGVTVRAASPGLPSTGTVAPAPVTVFDVAAPVPGRPLRVTLDLATQEAADAALASAPKPAALVAIRVGTGDVLAVANGGPNATGYDRALLGQYPPGSTFKIATTLALLRSGLTPNTPVRCPPSVTVNGKVFTNAEGEALGSVPFHEDFAQSCNGAFVGSAGRITSRQLADAADSLGIGHPDALGVPAFMGSAPVTGDPTQHAAQMIGQGEVLVSPLAVATMSAAVAAGRLTPPRLVLDPAPATSATPGPPLPAAPIAALRTMMREVVTSGTGTALLGVPGVVRGKTGTAEFGTDNPPQTHAWFTGYRGAVAFAVIVEGGGFGGAVAAPIAARFLRMLPE